MDRYCFFFNEQVVYWEENISFKCAPQKDDHAAHVKMIHFSESGKIIIKDAYSPAKEQILRQIWNKR